MLLSLFAFYKLPVEEMPKLVIPFILAQTPYPGAASEEVESQILRKLEKKVDTLDNIKNIYSISSEGLSRVFVEFYDDLDPDDAMRDVQDKVDNISGEFPDEAEDTIISKLDIDNMPVMLVAISGDVSQFELKNIAEDIKPIIESISGVAEVIIFGGLEREIHVNVDPITLAPYGITFSQISNALRLQNLNFPGGHLEIGDSEYLVRTFGKFQTVKEIGDTVIYVKDNKVLKLSDIAEISDSYKKVKTVSRLNGQNSVTLAVRKQNDINTLKTLKTIKKRMAEMSSTMPPGVSVTFSHDKSVGILRLVRQLGANGIYGGALVIFILFVTMGFRNALLISMAIPFSLLITLLLLYVFDMSINSIGIFSMILILGLVVDGAIIVGENIYQKFESGLKGIEASKEGILEVAWPVVTSDITTIAAFLPMLLVTGTSGQFLSVIPKVACFALIGSIMVDHIIIPTVATRFMRVKKRFSKQEHNETAKKESSWRLHNMTRALNAKIRERYSVIQRYALSHRKVVCVCSVIAVAFSLALIVSGLLGFEFFPKVDVGKFSIDYELPAGSSMDETDKVSRRLESRLRGIPEIVSYVTTIGNTHALRSDIREGGKEGSEYGKISVELMDPKDRRRTQTEILDQIKESIGEIPGVKLSYFELREGPPSGADIAIKIRGNNLSALSAIADTALEKLKTIPGAENARSDFRKGRSEIKVVVNREKASIYGINANSIANAVSKSFLGYVAATIDINDEEVDIRVQNKKSFTKNMEDVANVRITGSGGTSVPVGEVADIRFENSIPDIRRLNRKRSITVRANVTKGFSADAIKKSLAIEMAKTDIPHGYTIEYGGESEERDQAIKEMMVSMLLAIVLIYFILAIQFNSYKQPCIILIAIPLSFVGVVIGLVMTRTDFGFMSFVGIIALTGIVVNDSIVLVSYINEQVKKGANVMDAAMAAGQRRLRPVLMTTITTIGGLLPLTLNLGGGGDFWKPMGCSIIFGISVATFLTLIIVPVAYTYTEGGRTKQKE